MDDGKVCNGRVSLEEIFKNEGGGIRELGLTASMRTTGISNWKKDIM